MLSFFKEEGKENSHWKLGKPRKISDNRIS